MFRNVFSDEACHVCGDSEHGPNYLRDGHAYISNAAYELAN